MDTPQDLYDVAIVGLGPTGLTLAHLLGRRGLRVLALEREPQFYGNARAVYTDDECMRIFQAAGVAADVEADMLLDTPVQWVLEDGSVLAQLRRTDRPYGWALSNFFYQPYLETKMERLLARYPNVTVCAVASSSTSSRTKTGSSSSTPRAPARSTASRPPPRRSSPKALASARNGSSPATAAAAASATASESRWPGKAFPSHGSSSTSRRRRARTASATSPISTSIAIRSSRPSPARSRTAITGSSSC